MTCPEAAERLESNSKLTWQDYIKKKPMQMVSVSLLFIYIETS
jgi:hypothetical protein